MRVLNYHNHFNLGDCVFHMIYCNKLLDINDNIVINFYTNKQHFDELTPFILHNNINLLDIDLGYPGDTLSSWIGREFRGGCHYNDRMPKHNYYQDSFYIEFFNWLADEVGLEIDIKTNEDLLLNSNFISDKCIHYPQKIDYLIVNSTPMSGQLDGSWCEDLVRLAQDLHLKGHTVVTTACCRNLYEDEGIHKEVPGLLCTRDKELNLAEIGILSKRSKNLIAINTGPVIPCFGNNYDKFIILDNKNKYSYKNCEHLTDVKKIIL